MNNKILVGVITFFITILLLVLFFSLFDSNSKKEYSFERNFSEKKVLTFEKHFEKLDTEEYLMSLKSDNYLVERDRKNSTDYTIYFTDYNFKKKEKFEVSLPANSNIIFCNKEKILFTLKFKTYEYLISSKKVNEIQLKNFTLMLLQNIDQTKDTFLCFGEHLIDDKFVTGFFTVNLTDLSIKLSKKIETNNKSRILVNSLKYTGNFSKQGDQIIFCCEKYSKIYFFDNDGALLKELRTADETDLPNIITDNKGYNFYSQDGTWDTNMSAFINNNKVYVFSASGIGFGTIIIDEYSYDDLNYIQSYRLDYNNQVSYNVRNVYRNKNQIIIAFELFYASFIIS